MKNFWISLMAMKVFNDLNCLSKMTTKIEVFSVFETIRKTLQIENGTKQKHLIYLNECEGFYIKNLFVVANEHKLYIFSYIIMFFFLVFLL